MIILKYFWNYYEINKQEENKFIFISLELIEDIMDKYFNYYNQSHLNIYQDNNNGEKEKSIFNIFNFIIKKDSLGIHLKTNNNNVRWYKKCLKNPINNVDENFDDIYNNIFKLSNISLYKCRNIYTREIINDK